MSLNANPLLTLGYANTDVLAHVPRLPGNGDRVTALEIVTRPGGMAANCACAAALMGSTVYFFGNIGRDPFGDLLLESFKYYGVDTSHATSVKHTTTAIVAVTPEGERAIISESTGYNAEALVTFLKGHDEPGLLYLDGYHLGWALSEINVAKNKGHTIFCDLDGAPDTYESSEILDALTYVDIVQWNPKVAAAIYPNEDIDEAAQRVAKVVKTVISTRGSDSVRVLHQGRQMAIPVPPTGKAVDTTGAGDIFAGAFLHAYAQSQDVERAVRAAITIASKSTHYQGARIPRDAVQNG